jgi:hypothetical protein
MAPQSGEDRGAGIVNGGMVKRTHREGDGGAFGQPMVDETGSEASWLRD